MIQVVLVCNGGMSTSILASKINEEGKGNYSVSAYGEQEYGEHLAGADVVLLGPQIRYLIDDVKKVVGDSVPVASIDPRTYGTMNAVKVMAQIQQLLKK